METNAQLEWCREEHTRKVFEGRIRNGTFGHLTAEPYAVWQLERVRLAYLQPFPQIDYSSDSYRLATNGSAAIEKYFELHAIQQPGYLSIVKSLLRPGCVVADCGSGGGALLDLVRKETAGRTLAIEPFTGYHRSLAERGHVVYSDLSQALAVGGSSIVDVAISFHVIEHVANPVEYLAEMRRFVKPGGVAVVLTPNLDDILMSIDPRRILPFFYRRVHNYYFTAESLRWVGERAGWSVLDDLVYHEFGLANTLLWLRDGHPAGHTRLDGVDETADGFWKSYLERTGQSNNVGILLRNPPSAP